MANSFLEEAIARMRADGLLIDTPIADGKLHRCPTADKPRSKNGAYIVHDDNYPLTWWQNWATEITEKWYGKDETALTKKEKQEYARRMRELAKQAEAERNQRYEEAAIKARSIWEKVKPAPETHPYLERKQVKPCFCRINQRRQLIVPIYDPDGQLVNLQTILPVKPEDGSDKFYLTGGRKKDCYCPIPAIHQETGGPLLIAEGYATAASLAMATGYEVWISFDAGNLKSVSNMARGKFPERQIVICADNDPPNPPNIPEQGGIGALKGRKAAEAIGGYFALCPLWGGREKADFNDLACDLGPDRVQHEIETVLTSKPVTDCLIPDEFILKHEGPEAGLYWIQILPGGISRETRLGDPLHILGYTRTGEGDNWGLLLAWKDKDEREHQYALPKSMLAGQRSEWLPLLADMGWTCNSAYKKQIASYLENSRPLKRIRCVTSTGWSDDRYVLPDCIYGEGKDPIVLQAQGYTDLYQHKGSLKEWQELAGLCVGNPKLGFAVSCAFAGPLLELADMEGGLFSFEGGSSCGKTTTLRAAASVWGRPKFHVKSWRATDNSLEVTACLHNDGLLILDELGEASPKKLGETVYMLSGGQGKARAAKDGGLRKSYRWRVIALSSGELGLADKLLEDGKRARAGQDARFVAIPVTTADIANLHGMANSGLLVRQVKKLADTHYGVAGREFLKRLTEGETQHNAKNSLQDGLETIADSFCPDGCDGQVRRVALRFALVSMAGTLARVLEILPRDFEAEKYAKTCFMEWLEQRGGTGPAEDMAILNQVQLFIEQHGQSRFQDWTNLDAICVNRVGFRKLDQDGNTIFYVMSEGFKEIVKGYNPTRAAQVLVDKGFLKRQAIGHYTNRVTLPGIGRQRVYVLQFPKDEE